MQMDWQSIVVTCVAAGALAVLVRPFLPASLGGRATAGPACPSCAAGNAACAKERRVVITSPADPPGK